MYLTISVFDHWFITDAVGAVSGIIGTWGNMGGVVFSLMMREYFMYACMYACMCICMSLVNEEK